MRNDRMGVRVSNSAEKNLYNLKQKLKKKIHKWLAAIVCAEI